MKMFLTRLGRNAKAIVNGDVTQIDLDPPARSGLLAAQRILSDVEGIAFVQLTQDDVVRHRLVQRIINAFDARERPTGGSEEQPARGRRDPSMTDRAPRNPFGSTAPRDRARRPRGARAWYAFLTLLFTAATVVLLPPVRGIVDPVYREGQIADRDIAAPFALRVPLSGDDLRVARARASLAVPPVYQRQRKVERELTRDLSALLDSVATIVYARDLSDDERVARASQWLPGVPREVLRPVLAAEGFGAPARGRARLPARRVHARVDRQRGRSATQRLPRDRGGRRRVRAEARRGRLVRPGAGRRRDPRGGERALRRRQGARAGLRRGGARARAPEPRLRRPRDHQAARSGGRRRSKTTSKSPSRSASSGNTSACRASRRLSCARWRKRARRRVPSARRWRWCDRTRPSRCACCSCA